MPLSPTKKPAKKTYQQTKEELVADIRSQLSSLETEISDRNGKIENNDQYIYGDLLERQLDIPIGHDFTPVNWLRRTVEIHKNMFMSRGFQLISTYDTRDSSTAADENDKERLTIENRKQKEYAEARKNLIDSIIRDNGGQSLWDALAENASAVGTSALKAFYNEDERRYELNQIESIENLWAIWNRDDFRSVDAYAYVFQVSKQKAISEFNAPQDVATSHLGKPLSGESEHAGQVSNLAPRNNQPTQSSQPMVTIMEVTGKIEGWASKNGVCRKVPVGQETEMNLLVVGNDITRVIDKPSRIPHYYVFSNKRQRRRAWGISDISDAAININQTYVETLSDWRTVSAKVNFPKYKAFGFGKDSQLPKNQSRKIQVVPLSDGQDIQELSQGQSDNVDFRAQMDELKEQFVRETGISRVLFDDPSVTLNSNQALLTSMKPTSDIAEAKKQLWTPILIDIFSDALEAIAEYESDVKELVSDEENWSLRVQWPSIMQKEDPVFQQMLLNRFNANTISLQSYLEAQGESKEELDRIREELNEPVTAAILGRVVNVLAQNLIAPPSNEPQVKTNVNLRGDLTPGQEANLASQSGFNDGPFPPSMGPQGGQGLIAQENFDNQGFLTDNPFKGGQAINRGPDGKPIGPGAGQPQDTNTGQDVRPQVNTQANNQEGAGAVSQPGSGATPVSAEGAANQQQQQSGG